MFQRLPITLARVKAGNTSESLLKEIRISYIKSYIYQIHNANGYYI